MLGFDPLLDEALLDFPDTTTPEQAYFDNLDKTDGAHCFLVFVNTLSKVSPIGTPTGWPPMELPLMSTEPDGPDSLPTSEYVFSDAPWNSRPDDAIKPNVWADARLLKPFTMDRRLPINVGGSRRRQISFGKIEFANADGEYDSVINDTSIDGQRIEVYLGPRWAPFNEFKLIGDVYGYDWTSKRDKASMSTRDISVNFNRPIHSITYNGGGAMDGDAQVAGKTKPLCFGECFNVTPVQINLAYQVYQVHDGNIAGITACRDRGAPMQNTLGDFEDYIDLAIADIPPGQYATCNKLGLLRLAVRPDGPVTCDVSGDAVSGYTTSLSQICINILKRYAFVADDALLTSSFTGLPSGVAGYYVASGESPTIDQVMTDLLGATGSWYGGTRDRRLRVGKMPVPEADTTMVNGTLDEYDIISIERIEGSPPPRWRQAISYNKNWTPMAESDLATSVAGDDAEALKAEYSQFVLTAQETAVRFSTAIDGEVIESYYRDIAPAQESAQYIIDLYKESRALYKVVVPRLGYAIELGQVINLKHPRHDLAAGKNVIVTATKEESDKSKITLNLWG